MQVAVAEMAEDYALAVRPPVRQRRLDVGDVGLHVGDPQADVEGEDRRQVVELLDIVPKRPDLVPLGLRLAQHRVTDQAGLHAVSERFLELDRVLFRARAE